MGGKKRAKRAEARAKKLKKSLASVRAELDKSQSKLEKTKAKVARRKEEAAAHRTSAQRSAARVERLEKKLDRASTAADPDAGPSGGEVETTSSDARVPDDSWTVVQLRAEALSVALGGVDDGPAGDQGRRQDTGHQDEGQQGAGDDEQSTESSHRGVPPGWASAHRSREAVFALSRP